jgi:hypothetical protein
MKRKSEAASKKKLGRPRINLQSCCGERRLSRRQTFNLHYAFLGEMLIVAKPSLSALVGRTTVLAELGRFTDEDEDRCLKLAAEVVERFDTHQQKAAAAWLRAKRLGRQPEAASEKIESRNKEAVWLFPTGDANGLAEVARAAMRKYLAEHTVSDPVEQFKETLTRNFRRNPILPAASESDFKSYLCRAVDYYNQTHSTLRFRLNVPEFHTVAASEIDHHQQEAVTGAEYSEAASEKAASNGGA